MQRYSKDRSLDSFCRPITQKPRDISGSRTPLAIQEETKTTSLGAHMRSPAPPFKQEERSDVRQNAGEMENKTPAHK
jgi:hypothetical protein